MGWYSVVGGSVIGRLFLTVQSCFRRRWGRIVRLRCAHHCAKADIDTAPYLRMSTYDFFGTPRSWIRVKVGVYLLFLALIEARSRPVRNTSRLIVILASGSETFAATARKVNDE
jgi:hypothetical protein